MRLTPSGAGTLGNLRQGPQRGVQPPPRSETGRQLWGRVGGEDVDNDVHAAGGRRLCQSVWDWNSRPMASRVFSENGTPTTWRATGMLSAKPQGNTKAGSPARLPIGMMERKPGSLGGGPAAPRSSG